MVACCLLFASRKPQPLEHLAEGEQKQMRLGNFQTLSPTPRCHAAGRSRRCWQRVETPGSASLPRSPDPGAARGWRWSPAGRGHLGGVATGAAAVGAGREQPPARGCPWCSRGCRAVGELGGRG